MRYTVVLHASEEGYAVFVSGLPGCVSQGATEEEALENTREALALWLEVQAEQHQGLEVREVDISL